VFAAYPKSFEPVKLAALFAHDEQVNTPCIKLLVRDNPQVVGALAAAIQKRMGA